jgi:hypothetical protein
MTAGEPVDTSSLEANLDAIRESFGRVVYSHKTHEKAREIQARRATLVKWINIILTTVTSVSIISVLITSERGLEIVSAVLSALSLAYAISQLSFDPAKQAEQHRSTARALWYIREQYIVLLVDLAGPRESIDVNDVEDRRDRLLMDLKAVYDAAPDTTSKAYMAAQKALKVNEEMTFSRSEIDNFLPTAMRSASPDAAARQGQSS